MPIYILIAIVAIFTEWYKNSLMCRKAEGFYIDDFWATLIAVSTISNVAAVFFVGEVFQIHEVRRLFLGLVAAFLIDILIYLGYQRSARRKSLATAQFDITNDIKLS